MKFLFALACLFSTAAFAADTTAHIHEGNWEVGGSTSFTHNFSGSHSNFFNLDASGQYFFADEFSAGLTTGVSSYPGGTSVSVGPVMTKYLWVKEKIAPYFSIVPAQYYRASSGNDYWYSSGTVGVKFFLNDSIAFGPGIQFEHGWPANGYGASNTLRFLGVFSMHL